MTVDLRIELLDPTADPEAIDDLTADLREELLELDVNTVSTAPAGPAPEGSKGLEGTAAGALLLNMQGSLPLLQAVLTAVRAWLARRSAPGRSVTVTFDGKTLELSAATVDQQQRLVEAFLQSVRS